MVRCGWGGENRLGSVTEFGRVGSDQIELGRVSLERASTELERSRRRIGGRQWRGWTRADWLMTGCEAGWWHWLSGEIGLGWH